MSININAKAIELLESLANSIHDRETNANIDGYVPFTFRTKEIEITENFLTDLIQEALKHDSEN